LKPIALTVLILAAAVLSFAQAGEWQLTTTPGDNLSPAWCDGYIAFQSARNGRMEIWVMEEGGESSECWRVTYNPTRNDENPTWNDGCTHLYYQSRTTGTNRLYYVNRSGPPYQPFAVSLGTGDDEAPEASAAGVVFHSDEAGHDDIMWMPLGGEATSTFLTNSSDPYEDRYPCWSPGGSLIAFASDRSGNWDIWAMDAGGESRAVWQLTTDASNETEPAFDPSGGLVAFHREGVGIVAIDVASRAEYQVTNDPTDTQPCWSPTGNEIAFTRGTSDRHIWVTDGVPDTGVEQAGSWGTIKAMYR
jgi:Tol biopolymer transport system component